ncbi:MAG TPA: nucleoside deaminase [Candidatus Methylomirabilis sp.]|nr:nucleoside deaminase [Candidatus Methylomirabilis sp.]
MDSKEIKDSGYKELVKIELKSKKATELKNRLLDYEFNPVYPDDKYVWLTNVLALKGVDAGNFGVGSILVDVHGNVVTQGHNEVFNPYFRSDRHAEMVVMDEFESRHRDISNLQSYILYTSLESCPMCSIRLITSGVNKILHAADDMKGGMVREMKNLPQFWIDLSEGKVFSQARCSQELINTANEIFQLNVDELIEKIKKMHMV